MQEIDIEYNLKGKIQYACGCKAQVLVYHGTHGKSSMKCPVCGKFSLFDFDAMAATRVKPLRHPKMRDSPECRRRAVALLLTGAFCTGQYHANTSADFDGFFPPEMR